MTAGRALFAAAALTIALASVPAQAGTRQDAVILYSENPSERAFQERYGYNDAIILPDGTVYMSGVVVGQGDGESLEDAFTRAYERIGSILIRAGATWEDVVDITSFHTDVRAQLEAISSVHRRYISPPFPAWTAIGVNRLLPDRGIAEIKVVAKIDRRAD